MTSVTGQTKKARARGTPGEPWPEIFGRRRACHFCHSCHSLSSGTRRRADEQNDKNNKRGAEKKTHAREASAPYLSTTSESQRAGDESQRAGDESQRASG